MTNTEDMRLLSYEKSTSKMIKYGLIASLGFGAFVASLYFAVTAFKVGLIDGLLIALVVVMGL